METIMGDRIINKKWYEENKSDKDEMHNIILCSKIADDSSMWNPNEAVYWRKKAIEKIEKLNGKTDIQNTIYYDKISENLLDKGKYKEAIKWNIKSIKIKKKFKDSSLNLLMNILNIAEAYLLMENYEECIIYANKAMDILENCLEESECIYQVYLKLLYIWSSYDIYNKCHMDDMINYVGDRAIEIAEKIYGRESVEIAEAYYRKAISINKVNERERLKLLKKAIIIIIKIEEDNLNRFMELFYRVEQTWEDETKLKNAVYWSVENISRDFVLKATQNIASFKRDEVKKILDTM